MALSRKTGTGDLVLGNTIAPSLTTLNPRSKTRKELLAEENASFGTPYGILYANTISSIFSGSSGGLYKVDLDTGVLSTSNIISSGAKLDISPDESMILQSKSAAANAIGLGFLDTDTLQPVVGAPVQFPHSIKFAQFTPDGAYLVVVSNTSYATYVYDTTTWTQQGSSFQVGTNGTTTGIQRSHTDVGGNRFATWGSGTHGCRVYEINPADGEETLIINLTTIQNLSYSGAIFGVDSEEVIAWHNIINGELISVFDVTNQTRQGIILSGFTTTNSNQIRSLAMSEDGLTLYVGLLNGVSMHKRDDLSSAFDTGVVLDRTLNAYSIAIIEGSRWEILGNIDENLAETQWVAEAFDLITGNLVGRTTTSTSTFSIQVSSPDPVRVTVAPEAFDIWRDSKNISLNQKVYPTDPENTPYYYKCTTSGTTGSTEPTWPVTTNSTVTDGSVVWEIVERIIQPITHSPLVPTVVV